MNEIIQVAIWLDSIILVYMLSPECAMLRSMFSQDDKFRNYGRHLCLKHTQPLLLSSTVGSCRYIAVVSLLIDRNLGNLNAAYFQHVIDSNQ